MSEISEYGKYELQFNCSKVTGSSLLIASHHCTSRSRRSVTKPAVLP